MTARYLIADVFDGLATLETGSVDLAITSPPFLALRSYLPADHPLKGKEMGSEPTPAEFVDSLLRVTQELRRVLAPYGSICVELGDTYAGTHPGSGDSTGSNIYKTPGARHDSSTPSGGKDWPEAKSKALIPELYRIALAYGINPLTGAESPARKWRIRNTVTWCRPNPPVGALGDKWRPATSDLVVACTSGKRYWDDLATRKPHTREADGPGTLRPHGKNGQEERGDTSWHTLGRFNPTQTSGAPLLDYWEIPPTGYSGSHYAVFPPALVEPLVKAMCPLRVCLVCGEPSRRITKIWTAEDSQPQLAAHIKERRKALGMSTSEVDGWFGFKDAANNWERPDLRRVPPAEIWPVLKERLGLSNEFDGLVNGDREWTGSLVEYEHVSDYPSGWTQDASGRVYQRLAARKDRIEPDAGWSDCGHDNWRPGLILDPFAGSGTTLLVATGHGHDAVGIDLDARNAELALDRVGPFLLTVETLEVPA